MGKNVESKTTARMKRELVIPPEAETADQAVEVFRGWIINGGLQCSLLPTIWKKTPEVWGILLADAARHAANAIAEDAGTDSAEIFAKIRISMESELRDPSDDHEGHFQR